MKLQFITILSTLFLIGTCLYLSHSNAYCQTARDYVFPQEVIPEKIDNYAFSGYYYNNRNVYNLRSSKLSKAKGEIISMKINPAGSSYAVLCEKEGVGYLSIYDLWRSDVILNDFNSKLDGPVAICYSPDSKKFAVACKNWSIRVFDTKKYDFLYEMPLKSLAENIAISDNNYFLAVVLGGYLQVYNFETGEVRYETSMMSKIHSVVFSSGSDYMMTCTENGLVQLYETRSFKRIAEFDTMDSAIDCDFHPDNKYLAVIMNDKSVVLINRYDNSDRLFVRNDEGGITDICFVSDTDDNVYLLYNTVSSISYHNMGQLSPNYTNLLSDELDERMNDWMKMLEGETMQEYNLRVNEETRKAQMLLFEQEIATEMAGNLLDMSTVSLGGYDEENQTLALNFDTMPTIFLSVPENRIEDFTAVDDLEFRNPRYGLTSDDKFELVYVEVLNKTTGSLAVYDNRDRRELSYLFNDSNFIPLEIVQVSNMDEILLEGIKDEVMTVAKAGNIISDHTNIAVNTKVYSSVDANGNDILNYRVGFSYNVDAAFSAKEDFAPGRYHIDESGAAKSMLKIIKRAFETDFAQYVSQGKKVVIRITGMADKLPINGVIPYDASYGNHINEPVYGADLFAMTLTEQSGITTNEQLAFVRALGVKSGLEKSVASLSEMMTEWEYHVQVTDKVGGEYRRITVEFDFVDVF